MNFIIIRPFYTKYAWVYDKIIERPVKSDCDFIEKILSQRNSKDKLSTLDVGCGTGNYAIELGQRGFSVTGIDISKEQISVAQSKSADGKSDVEFIQADMLT